MQLRGSISSVLEAQNADVLMVELRKLCKSCLVLGESATPPEVVAKALQVFVDLCAI